MASSHGHESVELYSFLTKTFFCFLNTASEVSCARWEIVVMFKWSHYGEVKIFDSKSDCGKIQSQLF